MLNAEASPRLRLLVPCWRATSERRFAGDTDRTPITERDDAATMPSASDA